mgnify:CR=1 FL=1
MAEGPGFEPGLTESESVVLPLDDPPAISNYGHANYTKDPRESIKTTLHYCLFPG